jgi:GNAT superfamily N-acetyltransferase
MRTDTQGSLMTRSIPRSLPLSFEVLREGTVVPDLEAMTFPVYRRFLALRPTPRHPELGDKRVVQPLGLVAWQGERPVGLLLAERPVEAPDRAEVLSLFVSDDRRNAGVATGLVHRLEQHLRAAGVRTVTAVYMTGKPGIAPMERVFEKCRWTPPEARTISVWFTPEEAMRMPWFGRLEIAASELEICAWEDVTAEEKAALARSQEAAPWIPRGLEPWRHDFYGFERVSSVGLRHRGEVVGWIINHELRPGSVRFTCHFMQPRHSRRGRMLALYTESIQRLQRAGCVVCSFAVPMYYREMTQFLKRRCLPWLEHVSESRAVSKELLAPASL